MVEGHGQQALRRHALLDAPGQRMGQMLHVRPEQHGPDEAAARRIRVELAQARRSPFQPRPALVVEPGASRDCLSCMFSRLVADHGDVGIGKDDVQPCHPR